MRQYRHWMVSCLALRLCRGQVLRKVTASSSGLVMPRCPRDLAQPMWSGMAKAFSACARSSWVNSTSTVTGSSQKPSGPMASAAYHCLVGSPCVCSRNIVGYALHRVHPEMASARGVLHAIPATCLERATARVPA